MKKKTSGLPALSWRGKLIRNLLAVFFLLAATWVLFGCPAWTETGALRQLESTMLLEAGHVQCREKPGPLDETRMLVTRENYASLIWVQRRDILWKEAYCGKYAELDQGPVLFQWGDHGEASGGKLFHSAWLCPNPPEGAREGELVISLDYDLDDLTSGLVSQEGKVTVYGQGHQDYEEGSATLRARGVLEESGLMRFELTTEDPQEAVFLMELVYGGGYEDVDTGGDVWARECTLTRTEYRLELFDANGASMGEYPIVWPV